MRRWTPVLATLYGVIVAATAPAAVVAGGQFRAASTSLDRGQAGALATQAHDARRADGLGATLADLARRVGDAERGSGETGTGGGIGSGAIVVVVLLAGGVGLVTVSRTRRRRREEAEQTARLRGFARDDLVALGDEVLDIDLDVEMPGADPRARRQLGVALAAYERAGRAHEGARRPEDFAAVTSAVEEGHYAMQAARAHLAGREAPERRPPCFFDPRHGPSSRDVEWAVEGGIARPVPACEADAQRVERGLDPAIREVQVPGGRQPYWDAPAYYGPWAGGYFGGFGMGMGGFLPGLLFGEMLGGDFGGGDFGGGDF